MQGQPDYSLHLQSFLPPAGQSVTVASLDVGANSTPFGAQWIGGFLRVSWPALPNHVNPDLNVVATLVVSNDGGVTFQPGSTSLGGAAWMLPTISVSIPGVAGTGAPAGYCDFPTPPAMPGPIGLLLSSPAGLGDLTRCLVDALWYA